MTNGVHFWIQQPQNGEGVGGRVPTFSQSTSRYARDCPLAPSSPKGIFSCKCRTGPQHAQCAIFVPKKGVSGHGLPRAARAAGGTARSLRFHRYESFGQNLPHRLSPISPLTMKTASGQTCSVRPFWGAVFRRFASFWRFATAVQKNWGRSLLHNSYGM